MAQAIPGIYGGVTPGKSFVQLSGTTSSGASFSETLPLNGINNYVFYYLNSGNSTGSFISGGTYQVNYLNSAGTVVGSSSRFTYSPNSTFTNGVEVTPPNTGGPPSALGIQGTAFAASSNNPLVGAEVIITEGSSVVGIATTNGDGFFSVYYGLSQNFVTGGTFSISIYKSIISGPCVISYYSYDASGLTYSPDATPGPDYYVQGAVTSLGAIKVPFFTIKLPAVQGGSGPNFQPPCNPNSSQQF
jgi:hypothetical protein